MDNAFEQDLKLDMLKYDGSHPRHLVAIQRAASHYHKLANQAMLKDKEEQTMQKKQSTGPGHLLFQGLSHPG